jgi:hypothetical protein
MVVIEHIIVPKMMFLYIFGHVNFSPTNRTNEFIKI